MNEKVNTFLETKKTEAKMRFEEEKQKKLLELELYEKEYSLENSYSEEFPLSEFDEATSKYKYYKKVPIEISDEEYAELLKYSADEEPRKSTNFPTILTTIACVIYLFGFMAGFGFGEVVVDPYDVVDGTVFSFAIAFTYWSIALISGTLFLALAEIIKILDAIKKK